MTTKTKQQRSWAGRVLCWALLGLVAAIAAFAIAIYWLFYNNSAPGNLAFPLDLTALRQAAQEQEGPAPTRIEVETVSHTPVPKIAMVAGTVWDKVDLVRVSFQIISPDHTTILDTGHTEQVARAFGATDYDTLAWNRVQDAVAPADKIVITHAHPDHSGGLGAGAENIWLSPAQAETLDTLGEPVPGQYQKIEFNQAGLFPLAPGIVLIAAPGHTPGSQMIYVQQADGREFLFMGDNASLLDNISLGRPRSRYVTRLNELVDRRTVFALTAALRALADANPELALVPGHDATAIEELVTRGAVIRGFSNQ